MKCSNFNRVPIPSVVRGYSLDEAPRISHPRCDELLEEANEHIIPIRHLRHRRVSAGVGFAFGVGSCNRAGQRVGSVKVGVGLYNSRQQ